MWRTMRKHRILVASVLLFASACTPPQSERQEEQGSPTLNPPISVDQAVAYDVIEREDISSRSRSRTRAFVSSRARSLEARVQTSMKAAFELQQETGSSYVKVFHLISSDPNQVGTGTYYVDLSYAPDGLGVDGESPLRNGSWEATATDEVVDELTLEVEKLWWSHRGRFRRPDGFGGTETDEKALKRFIARELKIKPENVRLVVVSREPYP